jgi:hypothetical protein
MSDAIYSYEYRFLRASIGQLKDYLLSDEIFWNLGLKPVKEHPPYPQLSLGNVLLSLERLVALKGAGLLSTLQMDDFGSLESDLGALQNDWQVAWNIKREKEFGLRLRQWARFLDDLSNSNQGEVSSFTNSLRNRAILQLLNPDLPENGAGLLSELPPHDQRFKRLSRVGDFIWEKELNQHFSPEEYWFLYTQPNK